LFPPSSVRHTRVLLRGGHFGEPKLVWGGTGTRFAVNECVFMNRMPEGWHCQRKMQPNYPSVAKPCTSGCSAGRPHFRSIENKKRTKRRKVTALKDVSEAALAGLGPSRGVLGRSHLALAPKVLR
jgi:hypothetical protein